MKQTVWIPTKNDKEEIAKAISDIMPRLFKLDGNQRILLLKGLIHTFKEDLNSVKVLPEELYKGGDGVD